jgi:hypothetical protein
MLVHDRLEGNYMARANAPSLRGTERQLRPEDQEEIVSYRGR